MRTLEDVRTEIQLARLAGYTYARIASAYPGVNRAVVWRIDRQGHEPKDNRTRRLLGLTELLTVEVTRNGEGRFTKRTQPRP